MSANLGTKGSQMTTVTGSLAKTRNVKFAVIDEQETTASLRNKTITRDETLNAFAGDTKDDLAKGDVVTSFSTKDLMVAATADSLPNNKLVRCDEAKYSGVWQVTTQGSVTDDDRYFLT